MNTALRLCLLGGLIGLPVTGCRDTLSVHSPGAPSFDRATPGASFEWSVPPRFGMDRDGDGLIDYPRTPEQINPPSWTVNFNACALPTGEHRTDYKWYVDEEPVASVTSCQWSHEFPTEGTYNVVLKVHRVSGPVIWVEQVVTVQDWLMVSFGDSYASGEGVSEITAASDQLVADFEATVGNLLAAKQHLARMEQAVREAVIGRDQALAHLERQQDLLSNLLDACENPLSLDCLDALLGLPFDVAKAEFEGRVDDAEERLRDARDALDAAQDAFDAARDAVASFERLLEELQAGIGHAEWQPPYANEAWGGEDCHRSANGAPARAALALEESDPRTSVTFLHLACSGAQLDRSKANKLSRQIPWADELIGPREIDAVLLSIGGNDAGFADVIKACLIQQSCHESAVLEGDPVGGTICFLLDFVGFGQPCNDFYGQVFSQSAADILATRVATLPAKYEELARDHLPQLEGLLEPLDPLGPPRAPVERVRSRRVYITEYPDLTKDDSRAYCAFDPTSNPLAMMPVITQAEWRWMDQVAASALNGAVANAAGTHDWNLVGGIYSAWAPHGYCADRRWVIRLYETFLMQRDEKGVMHPNRPGHNNNGGAILSALMGELYPEGLSGKPRAPDEQFSPPVSLARAVTIP